LRTFWTTTTRRRSERRFRAPCDAKEGYVALDPGKYRVKVELLKATGAVLGTTSEGELVMPQDGHPQATPVIFELPDGVVIKAENQRVPR
jgi:hypothetical protein